MFARTKSTSHAFYCAIGIAALPYISSTSFADTQEKNYPNLSGSLEIELENDHVYHSDDVSEEINDLYPTLTLGTRVELSETISFNLEATLEPVSDADHDREFEDLGTFINVFTLNYETDYFSVHGGKFTPNFGIAWDATPGLFGTDINGDYEYSEMLGFGGGVKFSLSGDHTISASVFTADTSFLSDSIGNNRGPLEKSDGGAANTENLSSFAVAVEGEFENVEGFQYHIGFSSLNHGSDGDNRQFGYVAGAQYEFPINELLSVTPIAEVAFLDNVGGTENETAVYATGGINLNYKNWLSSLTYQHRDTEIGGVDTGDYIGAITVGYSFANGLEISAAWAVAEENNNQREMVGAHLYYALEF